MMKLNVTAFALASGLLVGLGLFLVTWFVIALDGSTGEVTVISRVFRGYTISPLGSAIGLLWGFVAGLVGGAIFAGLHNCMLSCASCVGDEVEQAIAAEMDKEAAKYGQKPPADDA